MDEKSCNDSSSLRAQTPNKASCWVGAKESPLKKAFLSQQKNQNDVINPAKRVVDFSLEMVCYAFYLTPTS